MTLKISLSQVSTQPNPTHGWTQPMTNSAPSYLAKRLATSNTLRKVGLIAEFFCSFQLARRVYFNADQQHKLRQTGTDVTSCSLSIVTYLVPFPR